MMNGQILIQEDFDDAAAGSMLVGSLGAPWVTWSGDMSEDVMITDEQAFSENNSVLFTSADPQNGGPGDVLLNLGELNTGVYGITWAMYVPSGNGAYFNIQHTETPGEEFGIEVVLRSSGSIEFIANNVTTTDATFPHDEWFTVGIYVNVALSQGLLQINEGEPLAWPFGTLSSGGQGMAQLGAINFYTYAGGDNVHYYIDDVLVVDLTSVNVDEHEGVVANIYPNPVSDHLNVEVANASGTAVVSLLDVSGRTILEGRTFLQQGALSRTVIDMHGLDQGLYLVRVQDGPRTSLHQVVKN